MGARLHWTSYCVVFPLSMLFAGTCFAQSGVPPVTGTPPLSSSSGGIADTIDLSDLNAHLNIPVFSKAGRVTPFYYNFSYDSSVWYPLTAGSNYLDADFVGMGAETSAAVGYVTYNTLESICYTGRTPTGEKVILDQFIYYDSLGTSHPFNAVKTSESGTCGSLMTGASGYAIDNSGYLLNVPATSGTVTITIRNGSVITPPVNQITGAGTITDSNGNEISVSATGVFTDTLGQTALTITGGTNDPTNPTLYNYTAPSGATAYYKVSYNNVGIWTNFGCSGIGEYGPHTNQLVNTVTLPDGTYYQFTYEPSPTHSGYYTGRVASVKLPTGGIIQYTYTGSNYGIECSDGSAAGLTRVTPDGTWTYSRSAGPPAQTVVIDPQNNETELYFQGMYETQRSIYQGHGTTLLKTETNCYNGITTNCNLATFSLPPSPKSVTLKPSQVHLPSNQAFTPSITPMVSSPKPMSMGMGGVRFPWSANR